MIGNEGRWPSPPRKPNIPRRGNVIQRSDSYSGLRPVTTRRGYHGANLDTNTDCEHQSSSLELFCASSE